MVQFKILSGKMAGASWVARHFPIRIGRGASADLRSEEPGVWDDHLHVYFNPAEGLILKVGTNSLASVNGEPVQQVVLRNGDHIQIGSLKLQFWLSDTCQGGLRFREVLTWVAIGLISLGQVANIYWLIQ